MKNRSLILGSIVVLALGAVMDCSGPRAGGENRTAKDGLTGTVKIDGSSTVFPLSQAVAEEFMAENPGVKLTVAESGTGGGFKKWSAGEVDINNASRSIKEEEKAMAAKKSIEPVELAVAIDGIAVVVNKENTFVNDLKTEELKKIWNPNSKVKTWKDIRSEWPSEEIKLYGPGTASGTFDYFTEVVVGESGKSRTDYTASEDDNVLMKGVVGDKSSLGYFGYAYYIENKDKLKIVKIDNGKGPIEPLEETINNGTYAPLSRPIFIYPSRQSLQKTEVKAFVRFYLENAKSLAGAVGYVPLPDAQIEKGLDIIGR